MITIEKDLANKLKEVNSKLSEIADDLFEEDRGKEQDLVKDAMLSLCKAIISLSR